MYGFITSRYKLHSMNNSVIVVRSSLQLRLSSDYDYYDRLSAVKPVMAPSRS